MKEACGYSPSSRWVQPEAMPGESESSGRETPAACNSSLTPRCSEALAPNPPPESGVRVVILIPAYQPTPILVDIVKELLNCCHKAIVVVDDGSGPDYADIFSEVGQIPNVDVVPHAINLGKGSALKAGINFILCAYPDVAGVVTVDADGQHDPADVRNVCEKFQRNPEGLVLGVRDFQGDVPFRSKLGNQVTRRLMRAIVGHNVSDSQTGLRVIPRSLLPKLLKVPSSGYEFELEMLIAVKHLGLRVVEQPIRTIYEPGNPSSHFHPLRDSMRIYYVLLRFTFIGLLTAAIDNLAFYLAFHATSSILESQVLARLAAVFFNYTSVKKAVFLSEEQHKILLPRYLLVLVTNATLSYLGIRFLAGFFSMNILAAKVAVETLLFFANFAIQRDFVFTRATTLGAETCAQQTQN